tara:strand:+ start:806 stop:1189 length:384 start_codon:yes stop_codon:yes gene_type:complete
MKKPFAVAYKTKQEAITIMSVLWGHGIKIPGNATPTEYAVDATEYNYIIVRSGRLDLTPNGGYGILYSSNEIPKIVEHIAKTTYSMNLTDQYKAIVTDAGIEVGCQTITLDKFEELSNLVKNFKGRD